MQINLFNGGLNTRVSPFLIKPSEAVECTNLDPTSGSLAPVKRDKKLNRKTKDSCYKFKGTYIESDEDRDYVEFQGKLYYSNGVTKPKWSSDGFSWYQLGIDAPKDSLEVSLPNNNQGLNIKALYGYYEGADGSNCDYFTESQNPYLDGYCGSKTLLNFEDGSVSGSYCFGAYKQIEFIKNVKSKIFEDGEQSKDNFYNGEATIYHKVENTTSSYVAVVCREVNDLRYSYPVEALDLVIRETPIHSKFANEPNWYVKTDKDTAFRVKAVRRAGTDWEFGENLVKTAGYISSDVGDYNTYPDIEVPLYIKPESEVVFLVKDKDGVIVNILSDIVPKDYTPTHTPNVGGALYFAGFSFEWSFNINDTVDIFVDGAKVATRQHSDIVRNNRVFVESKCIDRVRSVELEPILQKLREIQYVITYSNGSEESQPSEVVSVPYLSGEEKTVFPAVSIKPSVDPQVTTIKLYRRGGGLTQFSLVKQFANKEIKFLDSVTNFDLDGAVLDSQNNTPAPEGLAHLTISNVMLFGTLNDKLYFTEIAKPYVWNRLNFIDFEDTITGIGDTPNGLLVFTKTRTYIVTGTSPTTFSKYLLSGDIGCLLHKSIKAISNSVVWLSQSGICVSNGGAIQAISQQKLRDFNLSSPRCSAVLHDVYYLSHSQGTLVLDFSAGGIFYTLSGVYKSLQSLDGIVYGVDQDNNLVELKNSTEPAELSFMSANYSDGSVSNLKLYKTIYTHSSGDITLEVFIDGQPSIKVKLNEGFTEIKTPQVDMKGYYISFRVTGTGVLNEIEYKVEGRQNGR